MSGGGALPSFHPSSGLLVSSPTLITIIETEKKNGKDRKGKKKQRAVKRNPHYFQKGKRPVLVSVSLCVSCARRHSLLLLTAMLCSGLLFQVKGFFELGFPNGQVCVPLFCMPKEEKKGNENENGSPFCCCYRKPSAHETKKRKPGLSQLLVVLTILCQSSDANAK